MINKKLLQKRFSENARTYDQYASVQKKMARELTVALRKLSASPQRILEIGCGTGYLTERLCRLFPTSQIIAVDLAPGMLEAAQERLHSKHVEFISGDIEEMELSGPFDLIVSNATFQWLNELAKTIQRLCFHLAPGGSMHFSTFGDSTFHELHTSFEKAARHLQLSAAAPGQSFFTLAGLKALCARSVGSSETYQLSGKEGMEIETFSTVRDFFTSIKKIGANNSNDTGYCQRPSVMKKMMSIYEEDFRREDQITATYHCLYLSLTKKVESSHVTGQNL